MRRKRAGKKKADRRLKRGRTRRNKNARKKRGKINHTHPTFREKEIEAEQERKKRTKKRKRRKDGTVYLRLPSAANTSTDLPSRQRKRWRNGKRRERKGWRISDDEADQRKNQSKRRNSRCRLGILAREGGRITRECENAEKILPRRRLQHRGATGRRPKESAR